MKLLRAATLTVEDLERATGLYGRYFDYRLAEEGTLSDALAASWGTPRSAGCPFAVMQPASGAQVFIRFVEQPRVEGFLALRSHGWNAIEICVQDVMAANSRVEGSPFEIIGPPREIDGLPAIHPMQVKGPDEEIVYLTQIKDDLPSFDLPRAASPIDKLFILVMGCSDLDASLRFWEEHAGLSSGRDMEIVYTMLAKAYGSDPGALHRIATMVHERDVFLELDQYPQEAVSRPRHEGMLVPGCALGSFLAPDFSALPGRWLSPPQAFGGVIYEGRRAATVAGPDGTLVELIEGAP